MSAAPPVSVAGQRSGQLPASRPVHRWAIALAVLAVLATIALLNSLTRPTVEPASLAGAVHLAIGSVDSSAYSVTADLVIRNGGRKPVSVVSFTTTGVAVGVHGGLPESVAGRGTRVLSLRLEIPRCEGLPGRFGGFDVTVERGVERADLPFVSEPGTPLYREMAGLADRICTAYRNRQ